jgi:hypothetical protein
VVSLARALVEDFRHHRHSPSLFESITILRESLRTSPREGKWWPDTAYFLAEALAASSDEHKTSDHLIEAISLHRAVLEVRGPGHAERLKSLHALARLLCRPPCRSWTEAFALYHKALNVCPAGYPGRAELMSDLSECFLNPDSPFFDLSDGILRLSEGYADSFSHVNGRLMSAVSDMHRVEEAYIQTVKSVDTITVVGCSGQLLELYSQVIGLLPRAANLGLDHVTRLHAVSASDDIACRAATRALLLGRTTQAVELLEAGRTVFWSQTLHLRASGLDEVPDGDRQMIERLLGLLEHGARRDEHLDQTAEIRERRLDTQRRLNEELELLIAKIREYPGLERFLLPPAFETLLGALPGGFVVVLNASKLGQHALLLHRASGLVDTLELTSLHTKFDSRLLRARLPRDMGSYETQAAYDTSTRAMSLVVKQDASFEDMLATLWTCIVDRCSETGH